MSRAKDLLIAGVVLLVGRRRPKRRDGERIVDDKDPDRRAENVVLLFLFCATVCAIGFVVVYALDRLPRQTQLLGIALGLALAFLSAACVVAAKRVVVTEQRAEEYSPPNRDEEERVLQIVEESGDAISRRRLLRLAVGGAGSALGLALITPALSLGPFLHMAPFYGTPWRRGRRLVDEDGHPYKASDIEEGDFYTAYPEGADKEEIGSPLVLVRLPVAQVRARKDWAPHGILAYSKICTHAGCAISLYRVPTFPPVEPKPALVCPCHYSTFDPADAGRVLFGPAGRALPQLPLYVDRKGELRARGNFSGPVGPSWWGVRLKRPNP